MAAANAPTSSWPSIAMLTTPARSPITPPRAPKTSGTRERDGTAEEARRRGSGAAGGGPGEEADIQTIAKTIEQPRAAGLRAGRSMTADRRRGQREADHDQHPRGRTGRHHESGRLTKSVTTESGTSCRRRRDRGAGSGEEQGQHAERDRDLRAPALRVAITTVVGSQAAALVAVGLVGHWCSLGLPAAGSRKIARTSGGAAMKQHDQRLHDEHDVDGDVLRGLHGEAAGLEGAEQEPGGHRCPAAWSGRAGRR